MTDSTIDDDAGKPGGAGGGGIEFASSADELFGGVADESVGDPSIDGRSGDGDDRNGSDDDEGVEDRTAASVFGELKDTVGNDTDGLLDGETPDDIIESADEPEPEPEPERVADDDILADEGELEALLLTGRTKDGEFLWVDPADEPETEGESEPKIDWEANVETATDSAAEPTPVERDEETEAEEAESVSDSATGLETTSTDPETSSGRPDAEGSDEGRTDTLEDGAEENEGEGEDEDDSDVETETGATVEPAGTETDGTEGETAVAETGTTVDSSEADDGAEGSVENDATDAGSDAASPGLLRRLLSKLNPF